MAKVTMPQLGESVAEGTIGKWLKQPGDHVAKYEPLLEVITDKVNAEVPSPFEGTLREILAEEGATVPNDAEIAIIDTADGDAPAATGPVTTSSPAPPRRLPLPLPHPPTARPVPTSGRSLSRRRHMLLPRRSRPSRPWPPPPRPTLTPG